MISRFDYKPVHRDAKPGALRSSIERDNKGQVIVIREKLDYNGVWNEQQRHQFGPETAFLGEHVNGCTVMVAYTK